MILCKLKRRGGIGCNEDLEVVLEKNPQRLAGSFFFIDDKNDGSVAITLAPRCGGFP